MKGISGPVNKAKKYPTKSVLKSPLKDSSSSSSEGELAEHQLQSTMRRSMHGQVLDNKTGLCLKTTWLTRKVKVLKKLRLIKNRHYVRTTKWNNISRPRITNSHQES
ncbi:hypothetical protein TSAR_009943 [Trichomalopsis sarcophagae]|uniref:Uncharacterized protein n=1 Tax=Trichomalopsis sarcophagae TaxID=543379 RepID=A0A232EGU3_9HYME|nr:hypothetical protein TSAR_009943 [Trichomalopsis sarcophagae]